MDVSIEQLEEALVEAQRQMVCHSEQVSGTWSIRGDTFCDEYGLDYDEADEAQDRDNIDRFGDFVYEKYQQFEKLTGSAPDDDMKEKIDQQAELEHEWQSESYDFWSNIVDQINSKLPADL